MLSNFDLLLPVFFPAFGPDDDGGGVATGDTDTGGSSADSKTGDGTSDDASGSAASDPDQTFTKKELEEAIKKERERLNDQNKRVIEQLKSLQQTKELSDKQREELQAKITELEESQMTKEQLRQKQLEKQKQQYTAELEKSTKEANKWRTQYEKKTIKQEIQDACIRPDKRVINPAQVTLMLEPLSQVVEVRDEADQPTGKYETRIKLPVVKDGKEETMSLRAHEALDYMFDTPEQYGNLFADLSADGHGKQGGGGSSNASINLKDLTYEKYKQLRESNSIDDLSLRGIK